MRSLRCVTNRDQSELPCCLCCHELYLSYFAVAAAAAAAAVDYFFQRDLTKTN
jgi:hypothetical protein